MDLRRDSFDPSAVSDRLYFLDSSRGRYVQLDDELYRSILSGKNKLWWPGWPLHVHIEIYTHTHTDTENKTILCDQDSRMQDLVPIYTNAYKVIAIHTSCTRTQMPTHLHIHTYCIPKTTLLFKIRLMHATCTHAHSTTPSIPPEISPATPLATSANTERGTHLVTRSIW